MMISLILTLLTIIKVRVMTMIEKIGLYSSYITILQILVQAPPASKFKLTDETMKVSRKAKIDLR
ncbi:hypothetical protein [Fusobacterium mortiferum]|uniref:hypothetical protein n=1 Tax=Fusobacterium mortiferum TaxID=850 RepID=UPI00195DC739|nr:hypothetical protein [Fusobacterium sp.]MBM6689534.1 hypothetical protein [Fusobacterium mortiferum]MBM6823080.1 hypothetical protein [Fusobacterium mortiferum]MDO5789523.1 hypothetical protein [Fusobacterium sp.]